MNKHTPRPWRTIESTNKTTRTVVGPDFPGQGYIADVNLCRTNGAQDVDGEANAHLIAAAPAMYEGLKYLVHLIGEENVPGDILATIAQAEGK